MMKGGFVVGLVRGRQIEACKPSVQRRRDMALRLQLPQSDTDAEAEQVESGFSVPKENTVLSGQNKLVRPGGRTGSRSERRASPHHVGAAGQRIGREAAGRE
jgi:hypothetical protein